jgi:hypothetical protein
MSYSFRVRAATKAAAKAEIEAEFDRVLEAQPVHQADLPAARAAAVAYVDVLAEPGDDQDVTVDVSGYVSWQAEGQFTGSRVEVRAQIGPKAA